MQLTCPACAHAFRLTMPPGSDAAARVRCPSCAATWLVDRAHAVGDVAAVPPPMPHDMAETAPESVGLAAAVEAATAMGAIGFGAEGRERKRTTLEGPADRENIALTLETDASVPELVEVAADVEDVASQRPAAPQRPTASIVINPPNHGAATVPSFDAVVPPVRVSPMWSPAVDTEVTHEPSGVRKLPRRTLAWGSLGVAFVAVLAGVGVGLWLWMGGPSPSLSLSPSPSAVQNEQPLKIEQDRPVEAAAEREAAAPAEIAVAESGPEPAPEPEPASDPVVEPEPVPSPAPEPTPPAHEAELAAPFEVFDTASDANAPWLALRSRPNRRSRLLAELPDATGLRRLRRTGSWWKVQVVGGEEDGMEGWAHKRWIHASSR